jgi:hypothetical protein
MFRRDRPQAEQQEILSREKFYADDVARHNTKVPRYLALILPPDFLLLALTSNPPTDGFAVVNISASARFLPSLARRSFNEGGIILTSSFFLLPLRLVTELSFR